MKITSAAARAACVSMLAAGLVVVAPASAGAMPELLESCSVDWVDVDDGDDTKEITVTIAGTADDFAVVLDTRFRSFIPVDFLGRTGAGTTTYLKRYHDNDWDYLSVRPIDGGVKGDWTVCGNTSIFGPDLPPTPARVSTCEVSGGLATVTGARNGVTIETRSGDGDWQVLRTESVPHSTQPDVFGLAELGVTSATELRFVDIDWGFPLRSAIEPTPCTDPVEEPPLELPDVTCKGPNAYLGVRGQNILGFKVSAAAPTDPRVSYRDIVTRITASDGTSLRTTDSAFTIDPDGSVHGGAKVKDIAPGTYTVEVRYIARPAAGESRPRTDWIVCGTETVPA